jgi:hypothetical protein
VAARLGYPQSKCESGERRVDVIELTEFARLYGRPLDFFIRLTAARLAGESL